MRLPFRHSPGVVAAVMLLAGAAEPRSIHAQQPGGPASILPVVVEFRALTSGGQPVVDLRAGEVTVKVDGRERTIGSLDLVPSGGGTPQSNMPPPFATNLREGGFRDTLVLIEDESIKAGGEAPMRNAAIRFIGQLAPGDRAGVVTIPRGGVNVGLTRDRAAVETALTKVTGWARREETDAEAACRTRSVLDSLSNVFRDAAGGPAFTIVIFSGGLTAPMVDGASRMSTPSGLCDIRARDYRDVELALLASPVNTYVVYVPDPATPGAALSSSQVTGLEHLAGITGNPMVRLVGDHDAAIARLAASASALYHTTFVPDDSERNGRTHSLAVRVGRPGVDVMARSNVLIEGPPKPGAARAPSPRDMLRVAQVSRGLPLRAAVFVSRDESADKVRIAVMLEPADAARSLKAAAVGLYDEKDKLVVQATAEPPDLARTPPMIGTVAKPGSYRMRVAATDASGAGGTVDTQIDAALEGTGAVKLSSLVLGSIIDGAFAGKLQFFDEPSAVAYVEIYGATKGILSATLELADSEDGPAAISGAMKILGGPGDDRRIAMASIPLASFPTGDMVVRAIVSVDGAQAGRVTHTLRKAAR